MQGAISKFQLPPAPSLTAKQVRCLLAQAQAGNTEARDQLIEANLRLAVSIAQRFSGRGDIEDIFQVACIGLVKAIDQFDLSFDVRFSTYAVPMIIGEIRRFLRDEGPMKLSRTIRERAAAAIRTREELQQDLGRAPTPVEIGEILGIEREDVVEALEAVAPVASIHEVIYEDGGAPVLLQDKIGIDPESDTWVENYALRQACEQLPPRERAIVILRFLQEKTQTEVADLLGISQGQVSRLEKRTMGLLREFLMQ
ncbi:MAG: SigB/SigF/SigG family RNA polymerase sigma factor [Firmicutes bacterium]|jgi:RNA polymerase sporulation-specific sigma factor|nr:SigB/SigF/SigG family RNA polymerase sigma factor [Bacillota bacterium]